MIRRVVLSGGGTGGHIYPALTIAQEIAALEPTDFLFVGSQNGMENEIVPKEGYPFTTLQLRGLERKLTTRNIKSVYWAGKSVTKAMYILKKFAPDVVIGTGGYVCGPVLMAASMLRIPTLIQEQNVVPGVTNRILSRMVSKIALGYSEARPHFHADRKCVVTGNPIRREFLATEREEARRQLDIDPESFVLVVAGGSRGARTINQAVKTILPQIAASDNMTLLMATGIAEYENFMQDLPSSWRASSQRIRIQPYLHDMPQVVAAADLAVYRAGAIGIAELTAKGIPAILIPYPYATADHQRFNAKVLENHGAAVMIENNNLKGHLLWQIIDNIRTNSQLHQQMRKASLALGKPQAGQKIAELALSLVR